MRRQSLRTSPAIIRASERPHVFRRVAAIRFHVDVGKPEVRCWAHDSSAAISFLCEAISLVTVRANTLTPNRSQKETRHMPTEYKPGDKVPNSGIYDVIHDVQHNTRHQVTCVAGETFPPCNHCGQHPRFRLAVQAVHIRNHDFFKKK